MDLNQEINNVMNPIDLDPDIYNVGSRSRDLSRSGSSGSRSRDLQRSRSSGFGSRDLLWIHSTDLHYKPGWGG